jgi:hypothetical protein
MTEQPKNQVEFLATSIVGLGLGTLMGLGWTTERILQEVRMLCAGFESGAIQKMANQLVPAAEELRRELGRPRLVKNKE